MDDPPRTQERAHFRLRYPQADRPTLRIGDQQFEVSEVSEEGARIVLSGPFDHDRENPFTGVLRFSNGESDTVEGVILRASESELVANLQRGVSLKRMLSEQVRIRQKYPKVRPSSSNPSGSSKG